MSQHFNELVAAGHPTGEVVSVNRFIVRSSGLGHIPIGARVLFENDGIGLVRSLDEDMVDIFLLSSEDIPVGTQVVMSDEEMVVHPSDSLLGRVVDPLLRPLDGGGPLLSGAHSRVFAPAPSFSERSMLNQQLETGVTIVDTLFPVVMGQRIAIMGDPKSGKTSFGLQVAINQARLGRIVVLVLIAKRQTDIHILLDRLRKHDALKRMVVVIANSFAPLPLTYLAPYSGCAVAEYFWDKGSDAVIIYDDLSSHAKVYREMSLVGKGAPGRESYPGDMFYTHSSLLERAGRLKKNQATLTALPLVTTNNNDITSYLSTTLISITDGQIVFDVEEMQKGASPPVNTGLSVSRVGGRAQAEIQKELAQNIFKSLTAYRQASEFAHFGQELPDQYKEELRVGELIRSFFNQAQDEFYSLPEQQIMLKAVFHTGQTDELDIPLLKKLLHKTVDSALASETHDVIAKRLVKELRKGKGVVQ